MSVDSDATSETYGEMKVLELNDTTTDGPGLIANEFEQDQEVRDRLLEFNAGNTPPIFGNLLTLPVEDGFIYIEPVYAVRSGSSGGFPILQFVLVSDGDQVGIGGSLTESLKDMLGITNVPTEPIDPDKPDRAERARPADGHHRPADLAAARPGTGCVRRGRRCARRRRSRALPGADRQRRALHQAGHRARRKARSGREPGWRRPFRTAVTDRGRVHTPPAEPPDLSGLQSMP